MDSFKKKYSFQERLEDATRLVKKFPNRAPIIVEVGKNLPDMTNKKFLVPIDMNIGQFCIVIRKRINLNSTQALFIFTNEKKTQLLSMTSLISEIYENHKNEDGFLYLKIEGENFFG